MTTTIANFADTATGWHLGHNPSFCILLEALK